MNAKRLDKNMIAKMFHSGDSVAMIAAKLKMSKCAIYMTLYRLGIKTRGTKCRDAAAHSFKHGIEDAIKKFKITREALHTYRNIYGKGE